MHILRLLLTVVGLVSTSLLFSQSISYTAVGRGTSIGFETDYHSLGVNSSALGWGTGYEGKRFTTGTTELFVQLQSDSLNKDRFGNMYQLFRQQIGEKKYSPGTSDKLLASSLMYAKAGINAQLNMSYLSFSFQGPKFGGIAFNIVDNYAWNAKLNTDNAELFFKKDYNDLIDSASVAFDGDTSRIAFRPDMASDTLAAIYSIHLKDPINFNELTKGSKVKMVWNRSYNIGYGRKLLAKDSLFILYGGIGARFIQSIAQIDFQSDDTGATLRTALPDRVANDYSGVSSQVNPFNASSVGGLFPKPVGVGYGLDFSASLLLFKKFRFAAAVNNIGKVNYTQKVYRSKDLVPQELSVEGLDPAMIQQQVQELIRSGQVMTFEGEEKFAIANAGDFRLGGSFQPIKQIQVGMEVIAPFNKENALALQNPVLAFGAEFRPFKWISITTGYWGGGVYQGQIPLGINFITGGGSYEFGFTSRDMLLFLSDKSTSVSMALGFARVRF